MILLSLLPSSSFALPSPYIFWSWKKNKYNRVIQQEHWRELIVMVSKILKDPSWPQIAGRTRLEDFVPEFTSVKFSRHFIVGPLRCQKIVRPSTEKAKHCVLRLANCGEGYLLWYLAPPFVALDQQHAHRLGACQKCRISGPNPDLLNQNLNGNKIPRWVLLPLMFRKHWLSRLGSFAGDDGVSGFLPEPLRSLCNLLILSNKAPGTVLGIRHKERWRVETGVGGWLKS